MIFQSGMDQWPDYATISIRGKIYAKYNRTAALHGYVYYKYNFYIFLTKKVYMLNARHAIWTTYTKLLRKKHQEIGQVSLPHTKFL